MLTMVCTTVNGELTLENCLDFRFEKERYTPYTYFEGTWLSPISDLSEIVRVEVYHDTVLIHRGTPDGVEMAMDKGRNILSVRSRGYSNALLKNRPATGIQTNVTLASIGSSAVICPFVNYEQNTPTVDLINYYENTSIWDAIVCYTQQATGTYPYIREVNTVMSSKPQNPMTYIAACDSLLSRSYGSDYSKTVSAVTMSDTQGNSGVYSLVEPALTERNIIRLQSLPFDHEWMMNPQAGIYSRIAYSMRGYRYESFKLLGWIGVDLLDKLRLDDGSVDREISKLTVIGGRDKPVITELTCYHDAFCD